MPAARTDSLSTRRLVLTPLRPNDAAVMLDVLADDGLYAFTGGSPPGLEELRARYEAQVAGPPEAGQEWHNWVIRLKDGGQAVGFVQATVAGKSADLAWLVGVGWQGQGLATEAVRAMREWLTGRGIHNFTAHIHPQHTASNRLAAAVGLRPTEEVDREGEVVWAHTTPSAATDHGGQGAARVAVVLFDGVDLLDVGGPYEVFLTASRLARRAGEPAPFEVTTAGPERVEAYGGLGLAAQTPLEALGPVDVLVVPGAIEIDEVASPAFLRSLGAAAEGAPIVASVCTGAFLLSRAGLLPDSWTTHWEDIDGLEAEAGGHPERSLRWVDAGRVVTSGGLSSGIAMALHLVERLANRALALQTAAQLEYAWDPSGGGRENPAPRHPPG